MIGPHSFGQWVKQRRKALDMTREVLARQIGCAVVTLYKIEADERRPSRQMAELLARYLNVPSTEYPAFVRFARTGMADPTIPFQWVTTFSTPSNLPAQATELIGRDEAVLALRKRLSSDGTRLLTLTGPPGVGKTRLALQVASAMLDDFPAGVFFVPLASINDPALVCSTIVRTIGLQEMGPKSPQERLEAHLHDKQVLLVLDNFEHILPAAPQVGLLLSACPWLKILATSRAPLLIRHERQVPVLPLALPDLTALPDVETLSGFAAVRLFVERAQAVRPDFSLTEENATAVATLCFRVDGLPLAIELISARVKLLPPAAILERLPWAVMLQSDGPRDLEPRHRTLNEAIEWSYQLLSADEQTLFRRLGVFTGGWSLDAAAATGTVDLNLSALDGLASLLDKSLVKLDPDVGGEPRFRYLQTIRAYALEQMATLGELDAVRERHAHYFLTLAEQAEEYTFGPQQVAWFDRLELEMDNLRAALAELADTGRASEKGAIRPTTAAPQPPPSSERFVPTISLGTVIRTTSAGASEVVLCPLQTCSEAGLRLVTALAWFLCERRHMHEGLAWAERMLAANPEAPVRLRTKALHSAGMLAGIQGDEKRTAVFCEQALMLARAADDRWSMAWSLSNLGHYALHDLDQRAAALDESLALFRELDDAMGLTHTLGRRFFPSLLQQDYTQAQRFLDEAAARAHEGADAVMIGWAAYSRGALSWHRDRDLEGAKKHLEHSIVVFSDAHYQMGVHAAWSMLAEVDHALGDAGLARSRQMEALVSLWQNDPDRFFSIPVLAALATIARAEGRAERAATLFGAVSAGAASGSDEAPEKYAERDIAALRSTLGETAFTEAWAAGKAMTLEQVIDYALNLSD